MFYVDITPISAPFCNRFILRFSRDQLRSLYNICTILVQYLYVYNCTSIVQLLYIYCTTTSVGMVRVRSGNGLFFGQAHYVFVELGKAFGKCYGASVFEEAVGAGGGANQFAAHLHRVVEDDA